MKVKFLVITFVLISISCFSQSPLSIEKDFWSGIAIHQNGKKISIDEAKKVVNNSEIATKLNDAQFNRTIGAVISYPCAFAFGYTLGQSLGNNKMVKPNWTVGGIGAVGMIIGIILEGKGNKQMKEAVKTYNESVAKTTSTIQPEFLFIASENGIEISIRF